MTRSVIALVLVSLVLATAAGAREADDFIARTQQDVIGLCTVTQDDELYEESIAFCHGFLVGAYSAHQTERSGPDAVKLVCPPDPTMTRVQAIQRYVDWAKAHPEYDGESSIESLFKFLIETWPCPSVATGAGKEGAK